MPNMPYFDYQNPYNFQNQNNLTLEAFLEIKKDIENIQKKLTSLENRIESLETKKNKSFEYETSINMM